MFMAGCGCGCCDPVFTDDFDRADDTDIGAEWVQIVSGAEIKSNTLQMTGPCLIRWATTTPVTHPVVSIDSVTYSGSSKVSVKWTPLDIVNPQKSHVVLGQRDILGGSAISRYIGLELRADSSGLAPTVSMRLYGAGFAYATDELPIGWDDGPQYTSGSTPSGSDKYFDVTLCWEAENEYTTFRGQMKVKATISSYTGAFYTLEGIIPGAPAIQDVFLESEDGDCRWDDFSWSKTAPDFPECPYCGQCLFAADMTTADDSGTAAYSSSGGTFARNATTGALELTSTTATWLVDVPARSSLALIYGADWAGSSPTFDIDLGAISLSFSKTLTPEQVIAVTVNGSGASSIYAPLSNSTISICFASDKIVVATGTSSQEYDSAVNDGYTNLVLAAGSSMVTVQEIQISRADGESIARLSCIPCDLETDADCSVCPPDPFAPYGVIVATCELDVSTVARRGNINTSFPEPTNLGDPCPTSYVDLECVSTSWDNSIVLEGGAIDSGVETQMRLNGSDTAICSFSYRKDFCSNDEQYSSASQISISASMTVMLFKTADATPRFYLAADARLAELWPTTGSNGGFTWVVYDCSGGVITEVEIDVENLGDTSFASVAGYWNETEVDWPYWHSDYFTECDKVDFDLSGIGGVIRKIFTTATYPTTMTIHVPR